MKKILILHRYPPKQVIGTNASFIEFLNELVKKGFETHYLTYKERKPSQEIKDIKYIYLPFFFNRGDHFDKVSKTYLWIFLVPFYVWFLQKKHKYDLIYCDDSVPYYGFFTKFINPKAKVVIRLGDLQSGYSLADEHPMLFSWALKLEKFMWNKLDGVVAISEPFKKFIIDLGIPKKKITVVKESVNLDNVDKLNVRVPKSHKIMFHGSLLKCKGVKTLIEAFEILSKKHKMLELFIAGGGGEEDALKSYVQKNKIKKVNFTGWYNHEKLNELMKDVQISVIMRSPNMANNFVVTTCLLENWAFKKPVVVPMLESFRAEIKNWKNGVFFEAGNAQDLANKLEEVYIKTDTYEKLVKNGLKTAEKEFSHRKIAKDMVSALSSYL